MGQPEVILAIESSCDDTGIAVLQNGQILANVRATQIVHEKYGGVVPELASREHEQQIAAVTMAALEKADLALHDVTHIAYTQGPGLMGSLLVGSAFAKGLSIALDIPLIPVNHMHGHIMSHFIPSASNQEIPTFPFLCLVVSGGHTMIVKLTNHHELDIIGQTIDDAAGEAFDKTSKILGLPYPGGPVMDKLAKEGNPLAFQFPITNLAGLDFSFSGIKTAVLYFLRDNLKSNENFIEDNLNDLCASVQHTILSQLMNKLELAVKQTGITQIGIAGGVAANSGLRERLQAKSAEGWRVHIPEFQYCTDNAGMIAMSAYVNPTTSERDYHLKPEPRKKLVDA